LWSSNIESLPHSTSTSTSTISVSASTSTSVYLVPLCIHILIHIHIHALPPPFPTLSHTQHTITHRHNRHSRCLAWTFFPSGWSDVYNIFNGQCCLRTGLASPDGKNAGFTPTGWMDGMWSGQKNNGTERTVVLQRNLTGVSEQYFTFDPRASAVEFISAVGTTSAYQ